MTSRERLFSTLNHQIPDCVPVAPDISNMIPAKRTGHPFWDVYLYNKIPLWKVYVDAVEYFGFDSLMDGNIGVDFEDLGEVGNNEYSEFIISEQEDRILIRFHGIPPNGHTDGIIRVLHIVVKCNGMRLYFTRGRNEGVPLLCAADRRTEIPFPGG